MKSFLPFLLLFLFHHAALIAEGVVKDPVLQYHIDRAMTVNEGRPSSMSCETEFTNLCAIPIDVNWGRDDRAEIEKKLVKDVSGLDEYTQLRAVNLSQNSITDIKPVTRLPNLEYLTFDGNEVQGLLPFQSDRIHHLSAGGNQLYEVDSIASLPDLEYLNLRSNQISSFPDRLELKKLVYLNISGNVFSDTLTLEGFASLKVLNAVANKIKGLEMGDSLQYLESLTIFRNEIEDLSPISAAKSMVLLNIHNNKIIDLNPLTNLTSLKHLEVGRNRIEDISALRNLVNLEEVGLASNRITDITPLVENSGIGEGDTVDLSENPLGGEKFENQVEILRSRGVEVLFRERKE